MQATLFTKSEQGSLSTQTLFDTVVAPLEHMATEPGFTF